MTAFSPVPRVALDVARIPRWLGAAVAAGIAGLFCARLAVSNYGITAVEVLIAVPALLMLSQRPLVATIVLLGVVSSVLGYGDLPRVNAPGHPPINVGDVCLAAAVGGTLWRRRWRLWPSEVRRYFLALGAFLLLATVATIKTSLLGYTESRDALTEYRNWLYLGAGVVVALELSGELLRPFLNVTIGLATVIAGLSIAAAASPSVAHALSSLSPLSSAVITQAADSGMGAVRVRVVGIYFMFAMCMPTLIMVLFIKDRWRSVRIAALLLMLAAVGASLNRHMYGGLVVAVTVTLLLGGPTLRARLALVLSVAAVVLTLVVLASTVPGVASSVGQRASSVAAPGKLAQSSTVQDRLYELRYAVAEIGRHPWFGIGPNQFYGAYVADPSSSTHSPVPRTFIQNLYFYIATDYGIPAALAFMSIPAICLFIGIARLPHAADPFDRAMLAGMIGTLVGLLLGLVVGIYLQSPETTVAFGVSCGLLIAAALRTYRTPPLSDWKANVETC